MRWATRTIAGVAIVFAGACHKEPAKKAPESATSTAPSASSSSSSAPVVVKTSASPSASADHEAPPLPTPPTIPCTADPRIHWSFTTADDKVLAPGPTAGPALFACSPFKTGDAPLTLTVAPGTILEWSLTTEVDFLSPNAEPDWGPVHYVTKGLPKLAWVDEFGTFKWHVRGDDGEAFAFSVAAKYHFPAGDRCLAVSAVIVVKDTKATREAQAMWVAMYDGVPDATGLRAPPLDMYDKATLEKATCGDFGTRPEMRDVDGDGLDDAVFSYDYPLFGYPTNQVMQTEVLVRRGDTFASIGKAKGAPEYAADGTTFVVDNESPGSDCPARFVVFKVLKQGIAQILDLLGATGGMNEDMSYRCNGTGLHVDHDGAGRFVGFTDVGAPDGQTPKTRVWRWNGKAFALQP